MTSFLDINYQEEIVGYCSEDIFIFIEKFDENTNIN